MTSYGMVERSTLICLMAAGREVANTELPQNFGIRFEKKHRVRLLAAGLIATEKRGTTMYHRLTDKGWAWVERELTQTVPKGARAQGGALYALLNALEPVARRAGGLRKLMHGLTSTTNDAGANGTPPRTAAIEKPPEKPRAPVSTADAIRSAYRSLASEPDDWVELKALRARLEDLPRPAVDAELKRMFNAQEIYLTLNEDRGSLTHEDRAAALRVGVSDMHFLRMRR